MFDLQNVPQTALELDGLIVERQPKDMFRIHVDLEVHVWEHEGLFRLSWRYKRALLDGAVVKQMARDYGEYLTELAVEMNGVEEAIR